MYKRLLPKDMLATSLQRIDSLLSQKRVDFCIHEYRSIVN